ncbi:ABC-type multidrug transport system permease subunit [Aliiruegeria haliotis]|uniref:Transport permease protein n=1 Tax=Aliiruegeria haliotis TaxID=1280846 RepID=A0A2T0REP2_9RHOB|nr:ABC transporter permease [Aliiruegeria haliotis]PRY19601.1 ABC-type multidrug transport system permease subunit [Aliiruegeria haliotis]
MTFLIASGLKNLQRIAVQPWSVAIWIGVPLLVGSLLSAVMGGSDGETPKVHLLIADDDGSFLSGTLIDMLAREELGDLLILEPVATVSGRAMLDEGAASAMLVIPSGFQTAYLASEPQALRLVVNPLQQIFPEMAEELTGLIADFGSYAQLAFGPELDTMGELISDAEDGAGPETAAAIGTLASGTATKLFRALPLLTEAPIEIAVETTDGAREASFTMLFFPGLLMMSVILAAQGLAEDLWQEREMGTLRRLRSTIAPLGTFLLARVVSSSFALVLVILPLGLLGFTVLDLDWGSLPLTLAWLTLAGLMLSALASLIQVLAPTRKAAALFSSLVFFPLLLVGGSFFPLESMPDFLATFGRLTPNGMMLEPLKAHLIGTGELAAFVPILGISVAATLAMTAATAWRLRAGFATR